MADDSTFAEFVRRIRAGDAEAAVELVRHNEPVVRLEVRVRPSDPRLRRVFDSLDVCQAVFHSVFVRAATGQYDLEQPRDLVKLLVVMARKKVLQVRHERAQRRDYRRLEADAAKVVAAVQPSPSAEVAAREMLAAVRQRLSPEELQLAQQRAEGRGWQEIAAAVGGTGQGRRKQLERAVARVAQ